MNDEAKAVEELARTAGKIVDATRDAGGFVARILRGPLGQAVGILQDKLKYVRLERLLRLQDRVEAVLAERGLAGPTRAVALTVALPLLEQASIEEDDYLQDVWANLLANAADADCGVEVRRMFVSILADLGSLEVRLLEKIYAPPGEQHEGVYTTLLPERVSIEKPELDYLRPPPEVELALGNLVRLGLLLPHSTINGAELLSVVNQTVLGRRFVEACRR